MRALFGGNGRSDGRSANVAHHSFARKAEAVLATPASPVQIFHIEEIVLGHETDVFDESPGYENTRAAYRIDLADVLHRRRTANRRIPSHGDDAARHKGPMQAVVDDLI